MNYHQYLLYLHRYYRTKAFSNNYASKATFYVETFRPSDRHVISLVSKCFRGPWT